MSAAAAPADAADDRIVTGDGLDVWEDKLEERLASDTSIGEADREAIIRARRGQGRFKPRVMQLGSRSEDDVESLGLAVLIPRGSFTDSGTRGASIHTAARKPSQNTGWMKSRIA